MREMNYWVTLQMLDSPLCHVYALTLKSTFSFLCHPQPSLHPTVPSSFFPSAELSCWGKEAKKKKKRKSQSLRPGSAEGSRHSFVTLTSAVASMYRHEALLVQTRLYITYVTHSVPSLFVFPSPWVFCFFLGFSVLSHICGLVSEDGRKSSGGRGIDGRRAGHHKSPLLFVGRTGGRALAV